MFSFSYLCLVYVSWSLQNLPSSIIICENMLNEQNNLEKDPEKIDSILNFSFSQETGSFL